MRNLMFVIFSPQIISDKLLRVVIGEKEIILEVCLN